jgi:membrane carboxypeptidase/penicillin-binding protein
MGQGVFGIEAAAQYYYNKPAKTSRKAKQHGLQLFCQT